MVGNHHLPIPGLYPNREVESSQIGCDYCYLAYKVVPRFSKYLVEVTCTFNPRLPEKEKKCVR